MDMIKKILNKITNKDTFNYVNNEEFTITDETSDQIIYTVNSQKLSLRKLPSSDYNVFQQIIVNKEYEPPISYFKSNNIELNTVIDAGANIGLTSLYIKQHFPNVKIACIEPEKNNLSFLNQNLSPYIKDKSVKVFYAGLLGISGLNLEIGQDFRGGNDWAKQIKVSEQNNELKSITLIDIQQTCEFKIIDLLKIDIEGAETFLLEPETDLSFFKSTKVIAIEIHDEYECRNSIQNLLRNHNYLLFETGETTLAINKDFIK